MKPLSLDPETCKEMLGDSLVREIESLAKSDFDSNTVQDLHKLFAPQANANYWSICVYAFKCVVYNNAYQLRKQKVERASVTFDSDPELLAIIQGLADSRAFAEYAAGKEKAFGAIVGAVMKIKKYDPKQIKQELDNFIKSK